MPYDKGDQVTISATWKNAAGAFVDPDVVVFQYRLTPTGTVTTDTYNTPASNVVRDSLGHYHLTINVDTGGIWYVKVYSTGSGKGAAKTMFDVEGSVFD